MRYSTTKNTTRAASAGSKNFSSQTWLSACCPFANKRSLIYFTSQGSRSHGPGGLGRSTQGQKVGYPFHERHAKGEGSNVSSSDGTGPSALATCSEHIAASLDHEEVAHGCGP
jgi:hypothetical protein